MRSRGNNVPTTPGLVTAPACPLRSGLRWQSSDSKFGVRVILATQTANDGAYFNEVFCGQVSKSWPMTHCSKDAGACAVAVATSPRRFEIGGIRG